MVKSPHLTRHYILEHSQKIPRRSGLGMQGFAGSMSSISQPGPVFYIMFACSLLPYAYREHLLVVFLLPSLLLLICLPSLSHTRCPSRFAVPDAFVVQIPDVHDNVRYDGLHNAHLHLDGLPELYDFAKQLADSIVPQEYGVTKRQEQELPPSLPPSVRCSLLFLPAVVASSCACLPISLFLHRGIFRTVCGPVVPCMCLVRSLRPCVFSPVPFIHPFEMPQRFYLRQRSVLLRIRSTRPPVERRFRKMPHLREIICMIYCHYSS